MILLKSDSSHSIEIPEAGSISHSEDTFDYVCSTSVEEISFERNDETNEIEFLEDTPDNEFAEHLLDIDIDIGP